VTTVLLFENIALYGQIGLTDEGRTETNNAAIRVTDKRDQTVFPKKVLRSLIFVFNTINIALSVNKYKYLAKRI
jgi:hypothetical protein